MTADLVRGVEETALGWLSEHRARFALGADALSSDGRVNASWKPLGELAQVCASLALRTPRSDPLHARVHDLLTFAWRETDEGADFVRLQETEPFATYPLEVYAAFAAAGLRHPGYEERAAVVARTRGWRLAEQDPTRSLGVVLAEWNSGFPRGTSVEQLVERTWLGGLPEPWTFERFSGYALTHVVFHLTDWGRGGFGLPVALAKYLTDWLPAWLATCLEAGMWDLACELLAVSASLPDPPGPAMPQEAWTLISGAQHTSGALPEEGEGEFDTADFAHTYHSTLMAAFAAGLTAHRGQGATG